MFKLEVCGYNFSNMPVINKNDNIAIVLNAQHFSMSLKKGTTMYKITHLEGNNHQRFDTDKELSEFVTKIYEENEGIELEFPLGAAQSVHYIEEFCDNYGILLVWDSSMPTPTTLIEQGA